jgi:hypothetical protein
MTLFRFEVKVSPFEFSKHESLLLTLADGWREEILEMNSTEAQITQRIVV